MRRLVWIGESDSRLSKEFELSGYQTRVGRNIDVAMEHEDTAPPLFVVNFDGDESTFLEAIEVRKKLPGAAGVLLLRSADPTWIARFINEVEIFRIVFDPADHENLLRQIHLAREKNLALSEKSALLDESRSQNKELAELTENLEKIVEERTFHIEKSRLEAETKLSKIRRLVRFIKELGGVDSLEDLMRKLRTELRRYHGLGEPALVYSTGEIQQKIMNYRSGKFVSRSLNVPPPIFNDIRVSHAEDQKFLANNLSKPVTRIISIPLKLIGAHVYGGSILFVEHDLNEEQVRQFLSDFSQIAQPLSLVLDRLLLEYRLRRSSFQWEYTFDSLPNPIAIINDKFKTVRGNKLFDPEAQRKKCYKLFSGMDSACVGCPINSVLKTGQHQIAQVNVDGKIFQVHSYPIRLSHTLQISHVVNYYLDITHSRVLYGKVIQNEKMAAVGLLAGNIAHELNNPLTGIRALSQVIQVDLKDRSDEASTQMAADLKEIEMAAERSQKIIKNLLEFSTVSESKMRDSTIDEIVSKTIPMLKTVMRPHRSNIDLNCPDTNILVEPHLMQQVVFNLVNNACQAMTEPGEITIISQCDSEKVKLVISDTGPGIEEKIMPQIFEPFFTTKEEGKGTGLGLSMAKSVVEKFGGQINYSSVMGEGTSFCLELPVVERGTEKARGGT